MDAIIKAINNLIENIQSIWEFIQNIFSGLTVAFDILGRIITMAIEFLLTWPAYIQAFAVVTIIISVVFFLVGRTSGKSDTN